MVLVEILHSSGTLVLHSACCGLSKVGVMVSSTQDKYHTVTHCAAHPCARCFSVLLYHLSGLPRKVPYLSGLVAWTLNGC